jgi:hypothetical protein
VTRKSTDDGISWQAANLDTGNCSRPQYGFIYSNHLLHFIDYKYLGFSMEATYSRSSNEGISWQENVISPDDSINSNWPVMCSDSSGYIYITWFDYKYSPFSWTGDIFFIKSSDYGNSWTPYIQLTDLHHAQSHDITISGDSVFVVWSDDRWGFDTLFEIYFRMSTNRGLTWMAEERLTNAVNNSDLPRIAVSKNYLYVFWSDARENKYYPRLYYKRGNRFFSINESDKTHLNNNLLTILPNPAQGRVVFLLSANNNHNGNEFKISIYDICGRLIKILTNSNLMINNCGYIEWDCTDINKKEVTSGIYFIKAQIGDGFVYSKVNLLK